MTVSFSEDRSSDGQSAEECRSGWEGGGGGDTAFRLRKVQMGDGALPCGFFVTFLC